MQEPGFESKIVQELDESSVIK